MARVPQDGHHESFCRAGDNSNWKSFLERLSRNLLNLIDLKSETIRNKNLKWVSTLWNYKQLRCFFYTSCLRTALSVHFQGSIMCRILARITKSHLPAVYQCLLPCSPSDATALLSACQVLVNAWGRVADPVLTPPLDGLVITKM